jgi:hypothetical protein
MQVEYDLGQDDYVALNIHLNNRGSTGRRLTVARWALLILQAILLIVLFYPQLVGGGIGLWIGLLPIVGVAGLWLVVVPFVYRQWIRSQVKAVMRPGNAGLGHHWLYLSTSGICDRSEQAESATSWHEIEELAVSRGHLFLYTNPTTAHVVPRRAFANGDAFEEFVAQATELRESAQRHRPSSQLGKENPHDTSD